MRRAVSVALSGAPSAFPDRGHGEFPDIGVRSVRRHAETEREKPRTETRNVLDVFVRRASYACMVGRQKLELSRRPQMWTSDAYTGTTQRGSRANGLT